jgi:5'-nucleotidase
VDIDFSHAQKITERVARMILEKGLPEGVDFLTLTSPLTLKMTV